MRYLHEIFINCKLKKNTEYDIIQVYRFVFTGDERLLKDMICL